MILVKCRRKGGDLLAFGPDSRTLAARSETGLQLWTDVHSSPKPSVFRELDATALMQFTPDGVHLVFDGRQAGIIHVPTNTLKLFPKPDGYRFSSMTLDGRHLLAVSLPSVRFSYSISCWPLASGFEGKPVWNRPLKLSYAGRPLPLADGSFLLEERLDNFLPKRAYRHVLWTKDGVRTKTATSPRENVSERSATTEDGTWLASQHTQTIRIWNLNRAAESALVRTTGSRKIFTDIAFHPSGRWLAATSTDGTVKFFDTESWSVSHTFNWGIGKMVGVAFSPDGQLVAAGSDQGRMAIWDMDE